MVYTRTCLLGRKGGVGRTNTASAIASIFADLHKEETLLVDLDPQGNLPFVLNCNTEQESAKTYNILLRKPDAESQLIPGFENLSIFMGSNDLKSDNVAQAFENTLENSLESAEAHIICDPSSDANALVRQAINLCDTFVIVTDIDIASVKGAISSAKMLSDWNADNKKKKPKKWAFVINCFEKNTKFSNETKDGITANFPDSPIFIISKSQSLKNARRDRTVITRYPSARKTVSEVRKIVDWIIGE